MTAGTFVFNKGEIWLSNSWSPNCHGHGRERSPGCAAKGSASSGRSVIRCRSVESSVYFGYFLDPDQGQTGPVSWEVAPLPPPRPVRTFSPFFAPLYWLYRASNEAGPATASSTKSPENSRLRINAPASRAAKTAPSRCGTTNFSSTIGSAVRARSISSSNWPIPSPVLPDGCRRRIRQTRQSFLWR